MPDVNERRTLAESQRQTTRELAQRQYDQARLAELELFRQRVAAAKDRVAAAEAPLEFIPIEYERGSGNEAFDAAYAELDAARAALEAFNSGAPIGRDLAQQFQAAVDAADQTYNAALAAGFPEHA